MTQLAHTNALLARTDTPTPHAGIPTDLATAVPGGTSVRLIRRMAGINVGLVALQAVSAGFALSGYGSAVAVHAAGARALQIGALIQAVTALFLWWRGRVSGWVAGLSVGLAATVFLQSGLGYSRRYWLHVPVGVGIFGWLTRQRSRL